MTSARRPMIKTLLYGCLIGYLALGLSARPGADSPLGHFFVPPPAWAGEGSDGNMAKLLNNVKTMNAAKEKTVTVEQMKSILDGLEEKRLQIQKQSEALKIEGKRLEQLKQDIEENIEALTRIRKQVEVDLARLEAKKAEWERVQTAAQSAKIKQLVKAYTAMKPKKVAAIMDNMDIEIAKKIFMSMKGEQVGRILAYMKSHQAAKISESLTMKPNKKKS